MPQLDIVSYFPQFFWFCLFFTSFYVVLVQNYLPKLKRIFALREAYQTNQSRNQSSQELTQLEQTTQNVFTQSVQKTKQNCTSHFQDTQQLLTIQTNVFNEHTNQAFSKYQAKKVQLNQTVKNTVHQLQGILPFESSLAPKGNQAKLNQFFSSIVLKNSTQVGMKSKLK